jgi:4-hydroxy-3-methylbut-2-en-1-yl diphosphate reductase
VSEGLLVLAPLRIECVAARRGAPSAHIMRTGMGPRRARSAAALARARPARAVAVLGFCGALDDSLEPGSVVVAEELRGGDGLPFPCERLPQLEEELERVGIQQRRGPILSTPKMARGASRARLAEDGSIAVDMESAWLAAAASGRPFAALRAVVDTPSRELVRVSTLSGGLKAYRALGRAASALDSWVQTLPDEKET